MDLRPQGATGGEEEQAEARGFVWESCEGAEGLEEELLLPDEERRVGSNEVEQHEDQCVLVSA